MKKLILTLSVFSFILACSEGSKSEPVAIEKNVRDYFFMDDSVQVETKITDTIFASELTQMEKELEEKVGEAQHQIDTLQLYIDYWQDKMFELQDQGKSEKDIQNAKLYMTTYQLNQKEYQIDKMTLMNTSRVYLGLKRYAKDSIMGYATDVTYTISGESNIIPVLMNADFKIVD